MNTKMRLLIKRCTVFCFVFLIIVSMIDCGVLALKIDSVGPSALIVDGLQYGSYSSPKANIHTLVFDPQSSGLMPLSYTKYAGTGATLADQIADAEANGYTVHGAINGEFFSTNTGNYGTLYGRLIGDGRILSDHENNDEYCFVIDKDGSAQFVQSEIAYHFSVGERNVADIARINKRFSGSWAYDIICYFDDACGDKTDTTSSYRGVEVVCNKLDGSELTPDGILQGEIVAVNTNAYGSAIGENQFVLYACNGTKYYNALANLTIGETVTIHAEELRPFAKTVMSTADSTIPATYPLVRNGVDVTGTDCPTNGNEILSLTQRAQRSAIGIKENGSFVFFTSSGRNYNAGDGEGFTLSELADAMIAFGCKHAVNLDSGGSAIMIAGDETKYVSENRKIGSAVLIVSKRPTKDPIVDGEIGDRLIYDMYNMYTTNGHVMEFNPQTSNYIPLAYTEKAGSAKSVVSQVADAKSKGYAVHGAINGEFFSIASGNNGALQGRMISNGRILVDHENNDEYNFMIDKDGRWQFIQSNLAYHLYAHDMRIADIGRINKPFNGDWNHECISYFDSACGSKTYTTSAYPGVEVVFEKMNGTELIPEGVLEGKVVAVNTDSYATEIGENQFVLYACNGTYSKTILSLFSVGELVQIHAEEMNKESKSLIKKANSVVSATYPIVKNGVNVTRTDCPENDDFFAYAQRTAIGIKEDGTYVYLVCSGRNYNSGDKKGVTISAVADAMIKLGCKYAVNLDGGDSSTMVYEDEVKYTSENRPVGSVILIVSRNDAVASPMIKERLSDSLYAARKHEYSSFGEKALVNAAIDNAVNVFNDPHSMNGEFIRAYMNIQDALAMHSIFPKQFISYNSNDWKTEDDALNISNDEDGALVLSSSKAQSSATVECDVMISADDKLYFDMTASDRAKVVIKTLEYGDIVLNSLMTPDNIDEDTGDSIFEGERVYGLVPVNEIAEGEFTLIGIEISPVSITGEESLMTVANFSFGNAGLLGDVDESGFVNSSDARLALCYIAGNDYISPDQYAAADYNSNGRVETKDVRYLLVDLLLNTASA